MANLFASTRHSRGLIGWMIFISLSSIFRWAAAWKGIRALKPKRILDVGCGEHSAFAVTARHQHFDVVGTDIFRPVLEASRRNGVYPSVVCADARSLPFRDDSIDVVLCVEVLEHLSKRDANRLLCELERTSRGLVVLTTPIGPCAQAEYDGNPYQKHRSVWTVQELRNRGYLIRGKGLHGMTGDGWWQRLPRPARPLQYGMAITGTLVSYFVPRIGAGAVAWKKQHVCRHPAGSKAIAAQPCP